MATGKITLDFGALGIYPADATKGPVLIRRYQWKHPKTIQHGSSRRHDTLSADLVSGPTSAFEYDNGLSSLSQCNRTR
jgi:hypothetical protein